MATVIGLASFGSAAEPTAAAWTDGAVFSAAASSAATWVPMYQLQLSGSQLCLTAQGTTASDPGTLQLQPCTSSPRQLWTFMPDNTIRVYQLMGPGGPTSAPSPLCLAVTRGSGNKSDIQLQSCSPLADSLLWDPSPTPVMAGAITVIWSRSNKLRCLDSAASPPVVGATLQASNCGGATPPSWLVVSVPTVGP